MESQLLHHGMYQLIKLKTGELVVGTDLLLITKKKSSPEKMRMLITVRRSICIHLQQVIMIPTQLMLQTRRKLKKLQSQVKKLSEMVKLLISNHLLLPTSNLRERRKKPRKVRRLRNKLKMMKRNQWKPTKRNKKPSQLLQNQKRRRRKRRLLLCKSTDGKLMRVIVTPMKNDHSDLTSNP